MLEVRRMRPAFFVFDGSIAERRQFVKRNFQSCSFSGMSSKMQIAVGSLLEIKDGLLRAFSTAPAAKQGLLRWRRRYAPCKSLQSFPAGPSPEPSSVFLRQNRPEPRSGFVKDVKPVPLSRRGYAVHVADFHSSSDSFTISLPFLQTKELQYLLVCP